ncbi:MAG: hypothetical protein AABZ47_06065 [Planctomycetota bacterium]
MGNEFQVFQFEPAYEGCCVPVAILNSLNAIFCPMRIPPTVVREIYRNSLDDPQARRTSSKAIKKIVKRLQQLGSKDGSRTSPRFRCSVKYLIGAEVNLLEDGPLCTALNQGGSATLFLYYPRNLRHAVAVLRIEKDYVYCFDGRLRIQYRPKNGVEFLKKPGFCRGPNMRLKREWIDSPDPTRFYGLGPVETREAVTFVPL